MTGLLDFGEGQGWLFDPADEPERKEDLDQWFTDPKLAQEFVDWCHIPPPGDGKVIRVIEPTAGCGNLVKPLVAAGAVIDAYDLDPQWIAYLRKHYGPDKTSLVTVHDAGDFLDVPLPEELFDVCVMNPPLSGGMDGVFLRHLCFHWARRTCAIVQTRTMHSIDRRKKLWDRVKVKRIEFLSDRPSFGRGSPMRDFSFVEIEMRDVLRGLGDKDLTEVGFF